MSRFEIIVDIVTDEMWNEYIKTYDSTTGTYTGTLIPIKKYLDTFGQDTIDITYQVADIRKLDGKNSSYSKSISLPDTDNNRKVLENIHWLGNAGGFNPKRKTKCYVMVDTIIVFEGYIQVLEYNMRAVDGPEYVVNLSSSVRNFRSAISDTLLEELPWGNISEKWDYQHVQDSWNPAINKEVFYPFIDYGWNLKTQLLGGLFGADYGDPPAAEAGSLIKAQGVSVFTENFYPAIYLKSYIDRIFRKAGFTYDSDFFNSQFFRSLIVPYNGSRYMQRYDVGDNPTTSFAYDKYFSVGNSTEAELFAGSPVASTTNYFPIPMSVESGGSFSDINGFWDTTSWEYHQVRTDVYQQKFILDFRFSVQRISTGDWFDLWDESATSPFSSWPIPGVYDTDSISVLFCRKSSPFSSPTDLGDSQIEYFLKKPIGSLYPEYTPDTGILTPGSGAPGKKVVIETLIRNESYHDYGMDSLQPTQIEAIAPGNYVRYVMKIAWGDIGGSVPAIRIRSDRGSTLKNEISLNVIYGEKIDIGNIVAKNVKCYDFMSLVMNTFNLYIEPDKEDDSILHIEPRDTFVNSGSVYDWSEKVDISRDINMQIMAEVANKYTKFSWKENNEWLAKNYKIKKGYSWGEVTYSSNNDYATGDSTITTGFSPTPSLLVPGGYDPNYDNVMVAGSDGIIIPSYVEDPYTPVYEGFPNVDFKQTGLRILFSKKRMNCTFSIPSFYRQYFYFGIRGYGYESTGVTPSGGFPSGYFGKMQWYPYAGTLDDLYTPSFDLNWGAPLSLYYDFSFGRNYPQYNLFNRFWYNYLEQLNNKESRIVTVYMKLNPQDIANFSFRDRIFMRINHPRMGFNGGAYFTVNKISGYNPSTEDPCKVELLLLGDSGVIPATGIPSGGGGGIPPGGDGGESGGAPSS